MFKRLLKSNGEILEGDGLMALETNPSFDEFASFGNRIDTSRNQYFSANACNLWFSINWRQPSFADISDQAATVMADAADAPIIIPHQENTREFSWGQFISGRQRLANSLATDNLAQDRGQPTFQNWILQVRIKPNFKIID